MPAVDKLHNLVVMKIMVMKIKFSGKDCMPGPSRDLSVRSVKECKRRTITSRRPKGHHEALKAHPSASCRP